MQELIAQLIRLYLPAGAPAGIEQHLDGSATRAFDLTRDGAVRAIVIPFDARRDAGGARQWERLCEVAHVLQAELGLPAPAVSVNGATGFQLWMSFEAPVPAEEARQLIDLLRATYLADITVGIGAPVALPPCLNPATGKWAAFIHPGMGASFAEEPALDMPPPAAAQAAFLQGLHGISAAQLRHALDVLQRVPDEPVASVAPDALAPLAGPISQGTVSQELLLKDATLEDIVQFLHARNIEPTFRHLLPR